MREDFEQIEGEVAEDGRWVERVERVARVGVEEEVEKLDGE